MNMFNGRTALISGGAEGIGLSIAHALGDQGMNIVLADINEQSLQYATTALNAKGISTHSVMLDVAKQEHWQRAVEDASAAFGGLHFLVNNAGVTGVQGDIENQSDKAWRWALDVNLMGVVYGAKYAVPKIKSHGEGGWIINVASMAGMGGSPYGGSYTATKNAVVALSEGWAGELKRDNISVSVLCPGFVKTRIHESTRNIQDDYIDSDIHNDQSSKKANPFSAQLQDNAKKMVENGIEVELIGQRVVEALNQNEFYIFTHPGYRTMVQKRAKAIDDAFIKAAESKVVGHLINRDSELF